MAQPIKKGQTIKKKGIGAWKEKMGLNPKEGEIVKVSNAKTNLDRIIGMKGLVTEDITKDNIGEVKVDGKKWSAYADTDISRGEPVRILSINSVKLKVEKWEDK